MLQCRGQRGHTKCNESHLSAQKSLDWKRVANFGFNFIKIPQVHLIAKSGNYFFIVFEIFLFFFYFYKNIFKLNDDFKLSYEANSDNFIMEWFSLSSKIIKYGLSCKEEGIKAFSEEISNSLENLNENGKYLFLNLT